MCFNIIVTLIVDRWEELTEGARGLMGIPGPSPIPLPWGGEIAFKSLGGAVLSGPLLSPPDHLPPESHHEVSCRPHLPRHPGKRRAGRGCGHSRHGDQNPFLHGQLLLCRGGGRPLCFLHRVLKPGSDRLSRELRCVDLHHDRRGGHDYRSDHRHLAHRNLTRNPAHCRRISTCSSMA